MGPGFLGREFVSKTFQPPIHIGSIVIFSRAGEKTMRHRSNKGNRNRKGIRRSQRRGTMYRSRQPARNKRVAPRTAKEFFAKPKPFQDRWTRATHVISKMRADGISLRRASRAFGLNPDVVLRLVGPALRKRANGRYAAKTSDRLLRVLAIPTKQGTGEIAVRDSRQATLLAAYWIAVHAYLQTGDASSIKKFRGKRITDANGKRVRLVTDLNELDRLASAGVLSFESIYPK